MTQAPKDTPVAARLATPEDLPALEANETESTKGLSASYLELQQKGDYYVVVGLLDGQVGGRVVLDCRTETELVPEMKLLWVVPAARRNGLGAVMTQKLEAMAAELGYDEIFLGVTPDNPAAIPMYVSLGYAPTGEHRKAVNLSVIDSDNQPEDDDAIEAIYRKSLRVR